MYGVSVAPNLAMPEQDPTPTERSMVGYTSGVYTYAAWNTPDATARIRNRITVS